MKTSELKALCDSVLLEHGDLDVDIFVSTSKAILEKEGFELVVENYGSSDETKVLEIQVDLIPLTPFSDAVKEAIPDSCWEEYCDIIQKDY